MQDSIRLCRTCSAVDIRHFFTSSVSVEPVELGTWEALEERSASCSLCNTISTAVRNGPWKLKGLLKHDDELLLTSKLTGAHLQGDKEPVRIFRLQIVTDEFEDVGDLLLHAEDAHLLDQESLFHGRALQPDNIDTELVKSWLSDCHEGHPLCESKSIIHRLRLYLPANAMLVDVHDKCIVHNPPWDAVYAALSYKWGATEQFLTTSDQLSYLSISGGLANRPLSQTVRDAITLTEDIGMQYLWIDALCIVQDDYDHKESQISRMHRIYGQAAVTIIAASSEDADDGLFATSDSGRIVNQNIASVNGLRLIARQCFLDSTMNRAAYSKRGWTYQESILSRRILYVTSKGITMHCCQGMRSEELALEESCCANLDCTTHTTYLDSSQRNLWREFIIQHKGLMEAPNKCECVLRERECFLEGQLPYRPYRESRPPGDPIAQKDQACKACLEFQRQISTEFHTYRDLVRSYSRRNTTKEIDRVLAFEGIINLLGEMTYNQLFIGCLEKYLDLSLLWRPTKNTVEPCRSGELSVVPSWIWASHEVAVEYPNDTWFTSEVDWYYLDSDQLLYPAKSLKYLGNHAPLRDDFRRPVTREALNSQGLRIWDDIPRQMLYGWCQISTSFYVKDLRLFDENKQPVDPEWNTVTYSECIPATNSEFVSVELCFISRSNHADLGPYTTFQNRDWELQEHNVNVLVIEAKDANSEESKRVAIANIRNTAAWKLAKKEWRLIKLG